MDAHETFLFLKNAVLYTRSRLTLKLLLLLFIYLFFIFCGEGGGYELI